MNKEAFERICKIFEARQIEYKLLKHPACRTSAESAEARAKAGVPDAIGAKALLCKMEFSNHPTEFNLLVLPGPARLNSNALKSQLPGLKRFRFATSEEMFSLCGVLPGYMPPFASNVFSELSHLYVDAMLCDYEYVGFNAASLEHSMVVRCVDYLHAASPSALLHFTLKTNGM